MTVLTAAALVGAAANAGVFFAFSSFVMPALDDLPAPVATETMQAVNRVAVRPPFMLVLFGSAAACAAAGVLAAVTAADGAGLTIGGAAAFLLGAIAVTGVRNVPLNDALARVAAADADAARWAAFSRPWTRANHVRTAASVAAAALLAAGLLA